MSVYWATGHSIKRLLLKAGDQWRSLWGSGIREELWLLSGSLSGQDSCKEERRQPHTSKVTNTDTQEMAALVTSTRARVTFGFLLLPHPSSAAPSQIFLRHSRVRINLHTGGPHPALSSDVLGSQVLELGKEFTSAGVTPHYRNCW